MSLTAAYCGMQFLQKGEGRNVKYSDLPDLAFGGLKNIFESGVRISFKALEKAVCVFCMITTFCRKSEDLSSR